MTRSFIRGIKNLWYFRKVIWNFRDFDYSYNIELLRHSLVPTAERLKNGVALSGPDNAKKIEEFLQLTDESISYSDVCAEYKEAMDKSNIVFVPIEGTDTSELIIEYDGNKERKRELIRMSYKWEDDRWKQAWKIISDEGLSWWD